MDRAADEEIAAVDKGSSNTGSQSPRSVSRDPSAVQIHNTSDDETSEMLLYLGDEKPSTFSSFYESDSGVGVRSRSSDVEEGETVGDAEKGDIEDGEIEGVSNSDDLEKYSCRFYQFGRCIRGKECRFLHLSDKGLYTMFDSPVMHKQTSPQITCFVNGSNFVYQPRRELEKRFESAWDRALREAKERIKQSKMRKEEMRFEAELSAEDFITTTFDEHKPLSRPVLPEPMADRVVCAMPSRFSWKKSERKPMSQAEKPDIIRRIQPRKIDCDAEWRDPWRRSKTPPKRKRIRSRSFSNSSKSSRSCSSWVADNRHHSTKRIRRKSRPRSLRKRSSGRPASSSCSCEGSSTSSCEWTPKKIAKRKHKTLTRKTKRRRTPERIVLPYKRRSRSISNPTPARRNRSKKRSSSRSPSSSQSTTKQNPSVSRSCNRSCSNMSISPNSNSSLSRKSTFSNEDFSYKSRLINWEDSPLRRDSPSATISGSRPNGVAVVPPAVLYSLEPNHDKYSSGNDNIPPVTDLKIKKTAKKRISAAEMELLNIVTVVPSGVEEILPNLDTCPNNLSPAVSVTKSKTFCKKKKRISALEMELLKYQADFRKTMPHASVEKASTTVRPATNDTSTTRLEKTKKRSSENVSKSFLNEKKLKNKPSKRDLLMQQLRAVEDAIARKKKYISLT